MKAVISNQRILATHADSQPITFVHYPHAQSILTLHPGCLVKTGDSMPSADMILNTENNLPDVILESQRLVKQFTLLPHCGVLKLDAEGNAVYRHDLDSKWYVITATPLNESMPNLYVIRQRQQFQIKGGVASGRVAYTLALILPPADAENAILTDPV